MLGTRSGRSFRAVHLQTLPASWCRFGGLEAVAQGGRGHRLYSALAALLTFSALAVGCSVSSGERIGTLPSPGSDVVTGLDIKNIGGATALDGLRLIIRPPNMTGRAPATFRQRRGDPPVAYLDGVRLVDIRTLEQVHYTAVESIEFLDASTATIRYGTGHFGGALVVTTRKGRTPRR
jgi:hypothetical protein